MTIGARVWCNPRMDEATIAALRELNAKLDRLSARVFVLEEEAKKRERDDKKTTGGIVLFPRGTYL